MTIPTKIKSAPHLSAPLSDKTLIKWLKKNYLTIEFIRKRLSFEAHGLTDKLHLAIISLHENEEIYKQRKEVISVWRHLVGKAIVYLKYRDDREAYHDDEDYGVEKLNEFFDTFSNFEPLLYGAQEAKYRDHIGHMLMVFLTGEYLITNSFTFSKIGVGDKDLTNKNKISDEEKEAMWCLIALTHDLGIPLERITDINPKAQNMLRQYGLFNIEGISYPLVCLPVDDNGIRMLSSDLVITNKRKKEFITHVQAKYYIKFSEAFVKREHGLLSCLVLIKNLVYFLETDLSFDIYKPLIEKDAKQFLIRRNILRPIASHSSNYIYYQRVVDFSFLLFLFDEIHEWGRPRFLSMTGEIELIPSVTVKNLTENSVHYLVDFRIPSGGRPDRSTIKKLNQEIRSYFVRKCNKFRGGLRSAVSEDRDIKLTLEVVSNIGKKTKNFKLIHHNPEKVEIFEDSKEINLDKLSKSSI